MSKAKSLNPLPYAVLGFKIENFGGIKKTELHDLPNSAKWIFLTGENGYGKTTVLQALTMPVVFTNHDIYAKINLDLYQHGETVGFDYPSITSTKELLFQAEIKFDKILAYGSSRLNTGQSEDDILVSSNPVVSLFSSLIKLKNIEHQLTRWFNKQQDPEFKTKFESVCRVLKHLLPIREIKVDFKTDKVTYVENDPEKKGYEPVEFRQLASGFKSIIALVGDMILRLFETQPKVYDPAELEGIVLIDELDLHFHPNIQRELPRMLSEVFPKIQFIATTHSPIPILGAPEGSVFLTVRRNKEEGITVHRINMDVSELTPNLILTSPIFGFENIFAETHKPNQRIRTEETMLEKDLNDKVLEHLKAFAASAPDAYAKVLEKKPSASR